MQNAHKNNYLHEDGADKKLAGEHYADLHEQAMREIAPFGLRLQLGLRRKIEREAKINGRSLNSEIVDRLQRSMAASAMPHMQQISPSYSVELSDVERSLITVLKRLTPEKQLALLSLLK